MPDLPDIASFVVSSLLVGGLAVFTHDMRASASTMAATPSAQTASQSSAATTPNSAASRPAPQQPIRAVTRPGEGEREFGGFDN